MEEVNQDTGRNGQHLDEIQQGEKHHTDEKVSIQDNFEVEINSNNQTISDAEKELPQKEEEMLCLLSNDQRSCGMDNNTFEVTIINILLYENKFSLTRTLEEMGNIFIMLKMKKTMKMKRFLFKTSLM